MELNNPHRKCILLLMDKIVLLVFPMGEFCYRKAKLPVPEIISNTAPSYALGCKTTSLLIFIGRFHDIWLSVISMFSLPVYKTE